MRPLSLDRGPLRPAQVLCAGLTKYQMENMERKLSNAYYLTSEIWKTKNISLKVRLSKCRSEIGNIKLKISKSQNSEGKDIELVKYRKSNIEVAKYRAKCRIDKISNS